jgi:hypothetical protein
MHRSATRQHEDVFHAMLDQEVDNVIRKFHSWPLR